jgi:hypothetical protein
MVAKTRYLTAGAVTRACARAIAPDRATLEQVGQCGNVRERHAEHERRNGRHRRERERRGRKQWRELATDDIDGRARDRQPDESREREHEQDREALEAGERRAVGVGHSSP